MKKLFYLTMLLFGVMACSDTEPEPPKEVEYPHYKINIHVVDQYGETSLNLFSNPNHIVSTKIKVTCCGNEYSLSRFDKSNYNPESPFRLEQYTVGRYYAYRVVFDGFTIKESFEEELVIDWNFKWDLGWKTHMVVSAEVDYSKGEPQIRSTLLVDGELVPCEEGKDWEVVIVKEIPEDDDQYVIECD